MQGRECRDKEKVEKGGKKRKSGAYLDEEDLQVGSLRSTGRLGGRR